MPTDHRERLARIRRFDQLVAYLRDELGWPIDSDDFEELTFDYTPEELGIDAKNAAKIQEIKRLRPLVPGQPWGIFFVKFEPKRLPVLALRRILGRVVLKKRTSANRSERQAWAADDLLFVSNYGEDEERRIAFAHFSKPQDGHDLPTLKEETRVDLRQHSPVQRSRDHFELHAKALGSEVFQIKEGYVHDTGDGGHPVVIAGKCDRLALVAQVFA